MALAARLGTWQLAAASTAVFGAVTLSSAAVFRTCFAALLARAREKDAKDIWSRFAEAPKKPMSEACCFGIGTTSRVRG